MSVAETLAIRALNACRMRHRPTYVALRALLEKQQTSELPQLIRAAERKLQTRNSWRYFRYPIVKEVNAKREVEYRQCMTGSPFTLIAEAILLRKLSREAAFKKHGNVYSYLWPRNLYSGRNYDYYRYAFLNRNHKITKLLEASPNSVAVVNDVRRFYPSISWDDLSPKLDARLGEIGNKRLKTSAEKFIGSYRDASTSGLEIGPEISHFLADVAMEDVDRQMAKTWSENYFRYVDDIIVVCPKEKTDTVQKQLSDLISPLEIHDGKLDVVPSSVWTEGAPDFEATDKETFTFERLLRVLEVTILFQPERFNELSTAFSDQGFSVPFRKIAVKSRYSRFKRFVKRWIDPKVRKTINPSVGDLIRETEKLSSTLQEEARQLRDALPSGGTVRRWKISRLRYLFNRIIYLSNAQNIDSVLELLPDGEEFVQQRVLLESLQNQTPYALLPYPGAVVSTFCELVTDGQYNADFGELPESISDANAESLATFLIHFSDKVTVKDLPQSSPEYGALLSQLTDRETKEYSIERQSYLDESEQLLRDTTATTRREYAMTRTSRRESRGLEGFALGDDSDDDKPIETDFEPVPLDDDYR